MRIRNLNFLWLVEGVLVFLAAFAPAPAEAADGVRTNFISHGPGTMAEAMGEAATAVAEDATAIYYNPAGLAFQAGSVYAEDSPVFGGGRYNFLGVNYPNAYGRIGFGVIQYATGGIEARANVGDSPAQVAATQTAWYLPAAFRWRSFGIGATIKRIDENLAGRSDAGYGLDAGALYSLRLGDGLGLSRSAVRLGFSAKNVVPPSLTLQSDRETFPTNAKWGLAFSGSFRGRYNDTKDRMVYDRVLFSLDESHDSGLGTPRTFKSLARSPLSCGAQYTYGELISLRAGLGKDVSVGMGYGGTNSLFSVGYSLVMTSLAPQHRFSLSIPFARSGPHDMTPAERKERPLASAAARTRVQVEQFNVLKREAEAWKERLVKQARVLMKADRFEEAAQAFDKARALNPGDRGVAQQAAQAREQAQNFAVTEELRRVKHALASSDVRSAVEAGLRVVAVAPDDHKAQQQFAALRTFVDAAGPAAQAAFQGAVGHEVGRLHDHYHRAMAQNRFAEAHALVKGVGILSPASPVTDHLLKDFEKTMKQLSTEDPGPFSPGSEKNDVAAAARRLHQVLAFDPANAVLQKRWRDFQARVIEKNSLRLDRGREDQLYTSAVLHDVKGDAALCRDELATLLSEDPVSDNGLIFYQSLLERRLLDEPPPLVEGPVVEEPEHPLSVSDESVLARGEAGVARASIAK